MKKIIVLILLSFLKFSPSSAQIKVDYRAYQSPVKYQAGRGTCTAFAIISAMETFPGFPSDLSEQYVYAMSKMMHYKEMPEYGEGTFLKYYIDILQRDGTLREDQEPYNPDAVIWDSTETNFEKMKKDLGGTLIFNLLGFPDFSFKLQPQMYTYKSDAEAQNVEWIKSMLDKGIKSIPVSYLVNGNYWKPHKGNRDKKMDPTDFLKVSDGINDYGFRVAKLKYGEQELISQINSGKLEAYFPDTAYVIKAGHAVSIVGYDESGFLIKNSWSTEWGDNGYGWVSFDYHRLFAKEAMVMNLGKVYVDDKYFKESGNWSKNEFWIKSLPHEYSNDLLKMHTKSISLSVIYHGTAQMPRFNEIEIKSYDSNNNLIETSYGNTHGIFDGRETGYETYILQKDAALGYPSASKIVINFKTVKGETFTNTYFNVVAENKEYKPTEF